MSNNNTSSGGIGFTGALLLITFIVLKLCNVITWSWWWVLSPAWIAAGLALVALGILALAVVIEKKRQRKVVNKQGEIKSKWQQRLEEMQAKQEELKAQRNA